MRSKLFILYEKGFPRQERVEAASLKKKKKKKQKRARICMDLYTFFAFKYGFEIKSFSLLITAHKLPGPFYDFTNVLNRK